MSIPASVFCKNGSSINADLETCVFNIPWIENDFSAQSAKTALCTQSKIADIEFYRRSPFNGDIILRIAPNRQKAK